MKKLLYLALALIIYACAHKENKATLMEEESMERQEGDGLSGFIVSDKVWNEEVNANSNSMLSSTLIAENKLRRLLELRILQQTHPEFQKELSNQLKRLTGDSLTIAGGQSFSSFQNIRTAGTPKILNDSLQEVLFQYEIITKDGVVKDSITALLRRQIIVVDGDSLVSYKSTFQKTQ